MYIYSDPSVSVQDELESVITQMRVDFSAGNLTFPGVRERISPVEGSIEVLKSPWKGCGFGQQEVNMACSEYLG